MDNFNINDLNNINPDDISRNVLNDSTSTSCNNPVKPFTEETFTKMLESMKEAMKKDVIAYQSKFDYKLSVRQMIGFESTMFSKLHNI